MAFGCTFIRVDVAHDGRTRLGALEVFKFSVLGFRVYGLWFRVSSFTLCVFIGASATAVGGGGCSPRCRTPAKMFFLNS